LFRSQVALLYASITTNCYLTPDYGTTTVSPPPPTDANAATTELRYPAFPKRALVAGGTALLALMAVAFVVNRSSPSVQACAHAAERVMVARQFSVDMMELAGRGSVGACRGLSEAQYVQALLDTYQIEYGRLLAKVPSNYAVPPPSYRARSAMSESRSSR
jgi:hypothetical protein